MPNVLLEAMACGTPVISSPVGGAVEVVTNKAAGILLEERSTNAIAMAIRGLMDKPPLHQETRQHAEQFSWDACVSKAHNLLQKVAAR